MSDPTKPSESFDHWSESDLKLTPPRQVVLDPYDPRPQEDQARRNIAYCLIALLFLICFATFATLWFTTIPVEDVLKIFQIILAPVIALVSAATGFYYGTKTKS